MNIDKKRGENEREREKDEKEKSKQQKRDNSKRTRDQSLIDRETLSAATPSLLFLTPSTSPPVLVHNRVRHLSVTSETRLPLSLVLSSLLPLFLSLFRFFHLSFIVGQKENSSTNLVLVSYFLLVLSWKRIERERYRQNRQRQKERNWCMQHARTDQYFFAA